MTSCRPLSFATHCLLLCTFCAFSFASAAAQSATATLSGTVTDPNSAAVVGARVTVTNSATGLKREATTNDSGHFTIPLLPPSNYTVLVENQGFSPAEIPNVVLNVNDNVALNIQLTVGQVGATIDVKADANTIQETPEVATVVDRQFVDNLPLNGRSFQSLITLAPGVVLTKTDYTNQGQFSVNGQRADANYFTVDGVSANVGVAASLGLGQSGAGALPGLAVTGGTNSLVSVDALQEFKIQTSTFAPEFGRTPGAQVQIITRSGTNNFRGSVFEYFRNDVLDANDWFNNALALKKPALRQNDFGGVLGGPIVRKRTFFFFSYEGLRLRLPQTLSQAVPSLATRQAAVARMKPFLDAYPLPNGPNFGNGLAQFNASYSDPSNLDAMSIRIDHAVNDRLTFFGRYNYAPSGTTARGGGTGFNANLNSLSHVTARLHTLTFGSTQVITPTITNEFRANYTKSQESNFFELDNFGGANPPPDSVLFPSFASSQDSLLILLTVGGSSLYVGKNAANVQRQVNLIDNLSHITSAHQLKFGLDYRRLMPTSDPRKYDQIVLFTPPRAQSGIPVFVNVGAKDVVSMLFQNFSLYAQDTWKARPRLTLTYGIRWDVNPAPKGRRGSELFTFKNFENLPQDLTFAPLGTPLYQTTHNNFAPRIGIAYQARRRQGREIMLRGGFGVYYDLGSGSLAFAANTFPYSRSNRLFGVPFPLTPAQAAPPPFDPNAPLSSVFYVADPKLKLPRAYQWNVSVEQSLGSHQTVSATYVGAAGRRLLRLETFVAPTGVQISVTRNSAESDYHALQLQFHRRLSRGLQGLASYTWAHAIDIASTNYSVTGPSELVDSRLDRGSADFDVRHAFNGALTYSIPSPFDKGVRRAMFGNWAIDTILTARSATPVDLIGGLSFTGFLAYVRPDVVPGAALYINDRKAPGGRRFNPAAFAPPPTDAFGSALRQGTLGRNVLRGFSVWQVDMALHRQFKLTEAINLQFRAEAFNLFNHPNFGDPGNFEGNDLSSVLFGRSTRMLGRSLGQAGGSGGFNPLYQVGGPRSIQFGVKLMF